MTTTKNDRPALNQIFRKGDDLSLDDFDQLPTFEWDVTEILPNLEGGISVRSHMTFHGNAVNDLRSHIRKMVEKGNLKSAKIHKSNPFAVEVFFGHPAWTGDSIGYKIDLAPDEFNFTTLRRHLESHLVTGKSDDFVGPVIVHQSNKDTIEVVLEENAIHLNLLKDPRVPTRYASFEAPGSKTFKFDSDESAKYAYQVTQTIINKSSDYMDEVNRKWGLGKYRRPGEPAE